MKNTFKITLGGIVAALSIVIMFLSGVIPIGTYALPALAGILLIAVVIEAGRSFAAAVFAAVVLLSFFVSPDKETALCYAIFFGYYPILKSIFESINNKALQIILKLLVFNTAALASYFIAVNLLSVPADTFYIGKLNLPLLLLAVGNIMFIVYDFALTLLISTYFKRLRKIFQKFKK